MDPSFSGSNSTSSHRPSLQHPRTLSSGSPTNRQRSHDEQVSGDTRRGHSDGDVLSSGFRSKRRVSTEVSSAERDALVDMLWQPASGDMQDPSNRPHLVASRAAMMAADRRKRLSEHPEEQSRRKFSNSLSFVHPGSSHSRQIFTQMDSDRPSLSPTLNFTSTQRGSERPLPQQPSSDSLPNRRSREIPPPRWEPDAEVSKCPYCKKNFSFWYRKHHCRKCGRVVCANCSPHRITIPRQFIVHPPEDASPNSANNPGVEVVDLISDDDAPGEVANIGERPQSSEDRTNPALGGGQEVRLCNPCVPDPNPLPHVPFPSTTRPTFDSLPRANNVALNQQLPPTAGLSSSGDNQLPTPGRGVSLGHSEYLPNYGPRFDGSPPLAAFAPSTADPSANRRHSHASRPVGFPMPLPGYSSLYGSAPDQIAHQVSLQNNQ